MSKNLERNLWIDEMQELNFLNGGAQSISENLFNSINGDDIIIDIEKGVRSELRGVLFPKKHQKKIKGKICKGIILDNNMNYCLGVILVSSIPNIIKSELLTPLINKNLGSIPIKIIKENSETFYKRKCVPVHILGCLANGTVIASMYQKVEIEEKKDVSKLNDSEECYF